MSAAISLSTTPPRKAALGSFGIVALLALALPQRLLAFTPSAVSTVQIRSLTATPWPSSSLFSTTESSSSQQLSQSSLDKLETIKQALKRPRGASIGIEYAPASELGDGDLSILSMQLRKSKCAAIYTSESASVGKIVDEQEGSRGDFPGPVPVVYCGEDYLEGASGATATVVDFAQDVDLGALENVGIVWRVGNVEQLQQLVDAENQSGGVFLLAQDMLPKTAEEDAEELKATLSNLPKSIVTIAPLPAMLPENAEISLGKHYASLGISSLLLKNACVGDDEDIKYSQHAIESINKKSSSSFSMTGLTGSTNGHFGVASHEGAKWRRNK